jgi:class 3 adenylate cyclase
MAGEVLLTRSVVDEVGPSELLEFEPIGAVDLKGFPEPTELFTAARPRVSG